MTIYEFLCLRYKICSAWFLDIKISTCLWTYQTRSLDSQSWKNLLLECVTIPLQGHQSQELHTETLLQQTIHKWIRCLLWAWCYHPLLNKHCHNSDLKDSLNHEYRRQLPHCSSFHKLIHMSTCVHAWNLNYTLIVFDHVISCVTIMSCPTPATEHSTTSSHVNKVVGI